MVFKHGVHTIEINNQAPGINIAKQYGEYMSIPETEDSIEYEQQEYNPSTVTRIDYRFDSQDESYQELFPRMRQLVYTLAHKAGMYNRLQSWQDESGTFHSVRFMPDEKDELSQRGVEFYDKPYQFKLRGKARLEQGKARLELRRLNLHGERLSYIVNQWKNELEAITEDDYLAMLEGHAQQLLNRHYIKGERTGDFIVRISPYLIGGEEGKMLYRLNGTVEKHGSTRAAKICSALPCWNTLTETIKAITDLLTI